jgi:hypothetical protein
MSNGYLWKCVGTCQQNYEVYYIKIKYLGRKNTRRRGINGIGSLMRYALNSGSHFPHAI